MSGPITAAICASALDGLAAQRTAAVRVRDAVADTQRVTLSQLSAIAWQSPASVLFSDKLDSLSTQINNARVELNGAIDAIDRAKAAVADATPVTAGAQSGGMVAR